MKCPSTIHKNTPDKPPPDALVPGVFLRTVVNGQPDQPITYCPGCAALLEDIGWFVPDKIPAEG